MEIRTPTAASARFAPALGLAFCQATPTKRAAATATASVTATVRSLFVIDPKKVVRLIITYPASTGRNFDEVLRVIDSLQLTEYHSVATPGNWKTGDDVVIVPSLQDPEIIKQKFPKGYKMLRPYLRMTPQPNIK